MNQLNAQSDFCIAKKQTWPSKTTFSQGKPSEAQVARQILLQYGSNRIRNNVFNLKNSRNLEYFYHVDGHKSKAIRYGGKTRGT